MRPRMTKESYREYLQSPHWKKVSGDARRRASYRCEECLARNKQLHVHHLSYDHLGEERPDELAVLCEDCHRAKHLLKKTPTWEELEEMLRNWYLA